MPRTRKSDAIFSLLRKSPLAHELAQHADDLKKGLRRERRKIIPTAQVARMLGIGVRLLWQWIEEGALATFRKKPGSRMRSGIAKRTLGKFLTALDKLGWMSPPRKSRRRPAEERCREVYRSLGDEEALTPCEMAARAKVAISTVNRLVRAGSLSVWRPTPQRARICKQTEKLRKLHLRLKRR